MPTLTTPLATPADLASYLQVATTDLNAAAADFHLLAASQAVVDFTGQSFAAGTHDVYLPGGDSTLVLPQRPVTAVTTVEELDLYGAATAVTGYTRVGATLYRATGLWADTVHVVYTAGGDVPADVKSVVCELAAARMENPTGADRVSIDDYTTSGESDPLARLRRYRPSAGTIRVRPR